MIICEGTVMMTVFSFFVLIHTLQVGIVGLY
jgi:hypothetical protein